MASSLPRCWAPSWPTWPPWAAPRETPRCTALAAGGRGTPPLSRPAGRNVAVSVLTLRAPGDGCDRANKLIKKERAWRGRRQRRTRAVQQMRSGRQPRLSAGVVWAAAAVQPPQHVAALPPYRSWLQLRLQLRLLLLHRRQELGSSPTCNSSATATVILLPLPLLLQLLSLLCCCRPRPNMHRGMHARAHGQAEVARRKVGRRRRWQSRSGRSRRRYEQEHLAGSCVLKQWKRHQKCFVGS